VNTLDLSYPLVSLLANEPRRLSALADEAMARLAREYSAGELVPLAARLWEAVDSTAFAPGQAGVAIFVGDDLRVVPLSVPVRERVVIDTTFATRDLVREQQRSPRFRVLTLGAKMTRLYEGVGLSLHEVRGDAFPLATPIARERNGPARYVQALDIALRPHLDRESLPLVALGSESRLAYIAQHSRYGDDITATVRGAHDFPDGEELRRAVWPEIERLLHMRAVSAVHAVDETPTSLVGSGISDVWALANEGRGELLVVEDGFEYPACVDAATGWAVRAVDRDAPGVIDDLVDETVEVVLAKRGRVVFVPDGSLAHHEGIALKLRY
jgi:hypothetical protein